MTALLTVLLLGTSPSAGQQPAEPRGSVVVVLVTDRPDGAVALGLRLGAGEMERTTRLLRYRFRADVIPWDGEDEEGMLARLRDRLRAEETRRSSFLVIDLDPPAACGLLDALDAPPAPVILLARPQAGCTRRWLQLRASRGTRAALLEKAATPGARVDEWHRSLARFGAAQLNDRFRRHAGREMDGGAWAGWFAAKVATEAALRLKPAAHDALANGSIVFDGHKGVPLRFDAGGVLRQPLYLISADGRRVLSEVPANTLPSNGENP